MTGVVQEVEYPLFILTVRSHFWKNSRERSTWPPLRHENLQPLFLWTRTSLSLSSLHIRLATHGSVKCLGRKKSRILLSFISLYMSIARRHAKCFGRRKPRVLLSFINLGRKKSRNLLCFVNLFLSFGAPWSYELYAFCSAVLSPNFVGHITARLPLFAKADIRNLLIAVIASFPILVFQGEVCAKLFQCNNHVRFLV